VARPWRLRHKLVFGLALVLASVGLLLAGTLFGLTSYVQVIRTTDRKLEEMQICVLLREQIHRMSVPESAASSTPRAESAAESSELPRTMNPHDAERERLRRGITDVRQTLTGYEATLRLQFPSGSDGSLHDYKHIQDLRQALTRLEHAVAAAERAAPTTVGRLRLFDDSRVALAHAQLEGLALDHFNMLVADVKFSFDGSARTYRRSLAVTLLATSLALLLVIALLLLFRTSVFQPIQRLQAGVQRVHQGNFAQPIELTSQDELAELATEFNAMTIRLRSTYEQLEAQVNERTRQLVNSERMVSVGFLAAGVAHEINNPLASIAFCAESLERRLQEAMQRPGADLDVIIKYLRMIQEESQRCKQITQKLLDFSRSGGKRERADLTHLIHDVVEVAKVLPNARQRVIQYDPQEDLVAPLSIPDIKGVVLNLIVNALDSMDDGGTLRIDLRAQGNQAELRFTDTGCGMSPETLAHIFEPFFTRSRTGHGTGLGLSISHQIIDQHGGTIQASSPGPGQGSTFLVRLPLATTTTNAMPTTSGQPGPTGPTVLPFPKKRLTA